MKGRRFIMNAGRTTKQGQQINIGKDHAEYQAIVSTLIMHPADMKETGISPGGTVRVRSENGEGLFRCREGKVPPGMIFVPYGPPTCRLMGQTTDGTGMPTSKGWEVEVEPVAEQTSAETPSP
jgi:formylmethanofuran dehydrogenase subunit D